MRCLESALELFDFDEGPEDAQGLLLAECFRECALASFRPGFPQQLLLSVRHARSKEWALAHKVRLNQNSYGYLPAFLNMC